MSCNVLVIPEDFRKDQYVLKPIIEQMMQAAGVAAPRVRVCTKPLLQGVGEALKWDRLAEIIASYRGMVRLFLLVVDRDCDQNRAATLRALEKQATAMLDATDRVFLAEHAWQEIEAWVLAGMQDLPGDWRWKDVRAECHPKERYYDAYARGRRVLDSPYQGRALLAREAARNYQRVRQLCPEDVGALEQRIRAALS
jgi:hypothetical protein